MYFSNHRHQSLEQKVQLAQAQEQVPKQPANNIDLHLLDDNTKVLWDAFASRNCQHPFHLSIWEEIFTQFFGYKTYYFFAQSNGEIIAILPLVEMKSILFGHALVSTPFLVYGGPIGSQVGCDKLVEHAIALGLEKQVDYIELKCEFPNVNMGWEQDIYYNFKRPIISDHDSNLKDIPRKQRAVVRKAEKSGLVSVFETNIDHFYLLYATSLRNLGTPVMSKSFFQKIFDALGEQCSILTVFKSAQDKQPLSSVMSFYYNNSVLPYYAGGGLSARNSKSNDFMYWQLMKDAADKNFSDFNFGRSKISTGSYRFKTHWGFEAKPLHYRTIPIKAKQPPNLNPTNPKYQLMIKAWKNLPLPLSIMLGPWVARRLG